MRPRKRYLQGNKGTEGPTSLMFFDSESWMRPIDRDGRRVEGRLRLWVAAYVRREGDTWRKPIYHRGRTAAEFWDLVDRLSSWSRPLWAFAHNLGWDVTQLWFWDELEKWRYTAGPVEREPDPDTGTKKRPWHGRLCLESRPTFMVLRGRRGIVKLVDTGNYWPKSLAKVGEWFGVPKMDSPDFNGAEQPLWEYCTRDVDVCRVAVCEMMKWWLKEDCGVFQLTGPMLAMRNFQHTCNKRTADRTAVNIVLEDDSPARAVERDAYLGGRIEPFYTGTLTGPIYKLDCNSLYPFVMRGNPYPRKRAANLTGRRPELLARKLYAYGAIAHVLINTGTDGDTYPTRRDGVQVHACGRFWTSLAGPELRRAVDHGHVERVADCHLYSVSELFTSWADTWLKRKVDAERAGDVGQREFCKLILNSLPGKFGQRGDWWVDDPSRAPRRGWGRVFKANMADRTYEEWRYVAGHTQKRTKGKEPGNAFPAISAFVTSYAREYMAGIFKLMPERSLLYTATDSIICTQAGFDRLKGLGIIHDDEPGKFRVEDTVESIEIKGPNWYRAGKRWVISGLNARVEKVDGLGSVCKVWDGLGSLMGSNPRGRCGFSYVDPVEVTPTEKNVDVGDGWRRPLRLSLDEEFTDPSPVRSRWSPLAESRS